MPKFNFEAIGTTWTIEVFDDKASSDWSELTEEIQQTIEQFDKTYSRFRADSWVTELSQQAGHYNLPNDAYPMLKLYDQLYELSGGRVTPLIGQTLADAGYDADYSLVPKKISPPPSWAEVIKYDQETIELARPALLDFGAAGKGYLVDIVATLIQDAGFKDLVVNAGGDILHRSNSKNDPIEIGLENPLNTGQAVGIASLNNQSLCASAGSKRQWGPYNHILDPLKLSSPADILATWVVADDTMTADGLATALFFSKPAILKERFDFAYAILDKNMALSYSKDFEVEVFS